MVTNYGEWVGGGGYKMGVGGKRSFTPTKRGGGGGEGGTSFSHVEGGGRRKQFRTRDFPICNPPPRNLGPVPNTYNVTCSFRSWCGYGTDAAGSAAGRQAADLQRTVHRGRGRRATPLLR